MNTKEIGLTARHFHQKEMTFWQYAVIDMQLLETRSNKDLMETFIADIALQTHSFFAHKSAIICSVLYS